jgi:hypothetical protein
MPRGVERVESVVWADLYTNVAAVSFFGLFICFSRCDQFHVKSEAENAPWFWLWLDECDERKDITCNMQSIARRALFEVPAAAATEDIRRKTNQQEREKAFAI